MSCITTMSRTDAPAAAIGGPAARNRLLALLVSLAVALAVMAAPQLTSSSAASAAPLTASTGTKLAYNMLRLLNSERARHGLRPLQMSHKLRLSAQRHNLTMASKDAMSHQLPGEAFFADRITRTGYDWRAAGENIGWNSLQTNTGLQRLETEMYNEKAPDNGHRLNILSRSFRQVGISVYFDRAHHKMWFTQDFGQLAA